MKRRLFAVGGEGRARRFAAGLAAAALTIGVVAPLAGLPGEAAQAAPDDVIAAGRVFADFDGDGAFDADPSDGFEEHGVGAVTVTVTDALGRSATTRSVREQGFVDGTGWVWTSDGEWSMTEAQFQDQTGSLPFIKAGDTTAQLRVTFSDIPAGYESWFAGDYAQNATSIQFVLSGDESVDYALLRPEDNRIQPLDVITAIQSAGNPDPLQRNFIDTPAISAVDWMTEQAIHGFVDVDGDGEYTPGVDELAPTDENGDQYRYFSDDNGNGQWDDGEALSQVAFIDENGNGQWDQGPWFNATAYSGVTPADPATQTVSPVTVASVRVLLPNGQECWAGPFTFTERLVNPVTVSDSSVPRPVAYYQEITYGSGCSWAGWDGSPLQVVFVPGGSWEGEPQFTAFPTTEQTTPEDPRTIAMFSEVGSIWGTAYDQTANSALFSAVYKRVSGLAEHQWDGDEQLALGAIYRIPDVNVEGTGKVDPALGESGNVAPWFSLTALGIDLGDAESNSERGLAAGTDVVPDPHGFANAAKIGIGGIDTWTDGTTTYLYAMNLFDQTLYRIDISPAATDPTWVPTAADVLAIPLGLSPTQRPWAVEVWHDEVYVGWTDTGTAPGNCATIEPPTWTPPIDGEPAPGELPECDSYEPMEMVVAKVGLDGGAPVEVLSHPLGYPRGNPIGNWGDAGDAPSQAYPQVRHWNSWTDTWQWDGGSVGLDLEDISNWSTGNNLQVYPQAVLSSLTFTDEGFLSLGFTDRTALQAGNIQQAADVGQPGGSDPDIFFETISAGEMLVAGFDANQGRYILENLGYTRAWGDDGTFQQRWNEAVDHHTTGPGGREFYDDDQALDGAVRGGSVINHEEVALGAVLQPPGAVDVATTAYDPLANIRVQGLMWLTEESGEPHRAVELTDDPGQSETPSSSFQKGGGLGDLDAIIPPPPIEIGNRVWFDADQDGHQSADEPGIGGVRVELVDADGAVIGTQTTLADGTYYFSTRTDDEIDHYAPMVFGGEYTVRFVKPDGVLSVRLWGTQITVPWEFVPFTEMQVTAGVGLLAEGDNADGVNPRPTPLPDDPAAIADADRIDSNPDVTTGEYAFALGAPGENNHSLDAGFVAWAPIDIEKDISAESVEPSPDATYDLTVQIDDFRGLSAGAVDPVDPDAAFTLAELQAYPQNAGLITAYDPNGIADGVLTVQVKGEDTPSARLWVPIGSTVQVTEVMTDEIASVEYDPTTPVTLVDGDPTEPLVLRVTNTLASGTFSAVKAITGDAAGEIETGLAFAMQYSIDGGETWVDFTVNSSVDGDAVPWVSEELATGTVVQVREADPLPAPPTGVTWGTPTISGDGVTFENGVATFTIGDDTEIVLTVENVANIEPGFGDFTVEKLVTGEGAGLVPDGTEFPLEYRVVGDADWIPLTVTLGADPTAVLDLPEGTTIELREGSPLPAVPDVVWGDPTFSIDGGAPVPGPIQFTIERDGTIAIVLTNVASPDPDTFSVQKFVEGDAADVVAEAAPTIQVEWVASATPPDGSTVWNTLDIPWGEAVSPPEPPAPFPPGTTIWIREVAPPAIPGVIWGTDPQILIDGEPSSTDPASFEIVGGATSGPQISVTNTAELVPGVATLIKRVEGPAAGLIPVGTMYRIVYTIDGGDPVTSGAFQPGQPIVIPDITTSTATVTIDEVQPPEIDGVDWGEPRLTVNGETVALGEEFTVEQGGVVALELTNFALEPDGAFSVEKTVTGPAADDVPPGTEFVLEYSIDGGETWAALTVPLGELVTSEDLPAGTSVLVREGAMPEVPGVDFGTPTLSGDGVTITDEGWASFDIGSASVVALSLENVAEVSPGGFTAVKSLSGEGTEYVPILAPFTFEYSTDGGGTWMPLDVTADGVAIAVDGLAAGTEVLLRETSARPDLAPEVEWGAVTISGEGVTYDASTGIASFTIGAGLTVELTVDNAADLAPGAFSVRKLLDGEAAEVVPDGTSFTVQYTVGDSDPATATVVVGEPWNSDEIPAGARVTLTEVDLPEIEGVIWGDPVLAIDGVPQGADASFVLGAGEEVTILVTNLATPDEPPTPTPTPTPTPPGPTPPGPTPPGPTPPVDTPDLPATGADPALLTGLVAAGVLILGAGTALMLARRRRQD